MAQMLHSWQATALTHANPALRAPVLPLPLREVYSG
jgi:hypothetical protein